MQEDAFRVFILHRLSPNSRNSYLSNLRSVERMLGIEIDAFGLTDDRIATILRRLDAAGMDTRRMSDCGSALRLYGRFLHGEHSPPPTPLPSSTHRRIASDAELPAIEHLSVPELMRLYAGILTELRNRGVTRTANGPVGDYAEMLFQRAFCRTLESNSRAGYDAVDLAGIRYQIKARRTHGGVGTRQLGVIRRLPEQDFDVLAVLFFDADLAVARAILLPHAVVLENARRVDHVNGWCLTLTEKLCLHPQARDVTPTLRAASAFEA